MPLSATPLKQRAEQLASRLPPLLVAAERVASTVAQGVHGRRRVGQGETFWQFRHYDLSDSPQAIDWRQSAKSDQVFVREMEWEAAQSVWLWCDHSESMDWRSNKAWPTKRERADLLTLALANLLMRGGEHVSLLGTGLRPARGRATLTRLATQLAGDRPEPASRPGVPGFEPLPRYGQVVLFGDFLAPLEDIEAVVRRFAEGGVRGHIQQILDPAEERLPFEGRINFEGLEGESPWLLSRVEAVRGAYQRRMEAQRAGLRDIVRAARWTFDHHHCDRPPEAALLALYMLLSQTPER